MAYSQSLSAANGNPPYTWMLTKGSKLPKGLKLTKKDGRHFGNTQQVQLIVHLHC